MLKVIDQRRALRMDRQTSSFTASPSLGYRVRDMRLAARRELIVRARRTTSLMHDVPANEPRDSADRCHGHARAADEIGGVAQSGSGGHGVEGQVGLAQHPPDFDHAPFGDPFEEGTAGAPAEPGREVSGRVAERAGDVRVGDRLAERRLDLGEDLLDERVRRARGRGTGQPRRLPGRCAAPGTAVVKRPDLADQGRGGSAPQTAQGAPSLQLTVASA
ncbi:hypothetical protein OG979_00905 [Actinomadura citrea]|nr:hypothetical protein [Actinomadura citrea]